MSVMGLLQLILLITSLAYDVRANDQGTTSHLKEIFIGRCWEYQLIKYKQLAPKKTVPCEDLWNTFFKAFSFKDPCNVNNYQELMDMAKQDIPENSAMFWSGTYNIAHELAQEGSRYVTLEDSLIGYLVNSLTWCGSRSHPSGMNLTQCPHWSKCSEAGKAFWGAASTMFAQSVKGKVYLVLDGSRDDRPAHRKDSFFAWYELPNFAQVTQIVILVTHAIGGEIRETCDSGSILDLKAEIRSHNIPYRCIDDLKAIVHLLCADDPKARECRLIKNRRPRRFLRYGRSLVLNSRSDRFTDDHFHL